MLTFLKAMTSLTFRHLSKVHCFEAWACCLLEHVWSVAATIAAEESQFHSKHDVVYRLDHPKSLLTMYQKINGQEKHMKLMKKVHC